MIASVPGVRVSCPADLPRLDGTVDTRHSSASIATHSALVRPCAGSPFVGDAHGTMPARTLWSLRSTDPPPPAGECLLDLARLPLPRMALLGLVSFRWVARPPGLDPDLEQTSQLRCVTRCDRIGSAMRTESVLPISEF